MSKISEMLLPGVVLSEMLLPNTETLLPFARLRHMALLGTSTEVAFDRQ